MPEKNDLSYESVLASLNDAIQQIPLAKKAVEEQMPEGDAKDEEIKKLTKQLKDANKSLEEFKAAAAKPDLSNADIDPDDPDANKGPIPHEFKSLEDFCLDLMSEGKNGEYTSKRLKNWRTAVTEYQERTKATQTVGSEAEGGTLLPTQFSNEILQLIPQENDIMSQAMILNMQVPQLTIPIIMGFDESQGKVYGNIIWYWKGEEQQYTGSNFETGTVELNLHTLTGMARVSRMLMKYSPKSIGDILKRGFASGMSTALTKAFIRGTGSGQPKGVLIDGGHRISVAKATNQIADTFILDNIGDMFARLYSQTDDIGSGKWYANRTLVPQLIQLNQASGTGGNGVFLVDGQIQEKPRYALLGIPLTFSNQMGKVGDQGDIGLFDFSQYLIGLPAGGLDGELATSIHFHFDYGSTDFRWTIDIDGQPWWPAEYKPPYGDSQAPFIILDERA